MRLCERILENSSQYQSVEINFKDVLPEVVVLFACDNSEVLSVRKAGICWEHFLDNDWHA